MLLSLVHPGKGSWTRAYPLRTRSRNSCVGRWSSCTQSTSGANNVRNRSRAGARAGQRSVSQMLQVMSERRVGTISVLHGPLEPPWPYLPSRPDLAFRGLALETFLAGDLASFFGRVSVKSKACLRHAASALASFAFA